MTLVVRRLIRSISMTSQTFCQLVKSIEIKDIYRYLLFLWLNLTEIFLNASQFTYCQCTTLNMFATVIASLKTWSNEDES